jgi:hypothetical protein
MENSNKKPLGTIVMIIGAVWALYHLGRSIWFMISFGRFFFSPITAIYVIVGVVLVVIGMKLSGIGSIGRKEKESCALCNGKLGSLMKVEIADNQFICADCNLLITGTTEISKMDKRNRELESQYGKRKTWTVEVCKAAMEEGSNKIIEAAELANKEFRNKCNVCGHIYCYNQRDIDANKSRSTMAVLESVGGLASTLFSPAITAGTTSAMNRANAQNQLDGIVDYTKCPKCNSTDIHAFSDEEWESEKLSRSAPQTNTPTIFSADELQKFKGLLDSGVITQDEFDAKKKQLLGL